MTAIAEFIFRHPLVDILGWTLVHFLWQALVVAIPLALVLFALRRRATAQVRYVVACAGLLMLAALPTATFILQVQASDPVRWQRVKHEVAMGASGQREGVTNDGAGDFPATMPTDVNVKKRTGRKGQASLLVISDDVRWSGVVSVVLGSSLNGSSGRCAGLAGVNAGSGYQCREQPGPAQGRNGKQQPGHSGRKRPTRGAGVGAAGLRSGVGEEFGTGAAGGAVGLLEKGGQSKIAS